MKHPYSDILVAIANGEQFIHATAGCIIEPSQILYLISTDKLAPSLLKIKPKTILINGHEVPEPMKVRPRYLTSCYYPVLNYYDFYDHIDWDCESEFCERMFNFGVLHSTKEAAIKHAEALISFTKVNKE